MGVGTGAFAQTNVINSREWVDLGLPSGTLWAACNVGAESPEEFGEYFNWKNNPVQEYWDADWRTPTKSERDELVEYCTYSVEYVNGVKGARYTGSNGQTVFFPFAGYYQNNSGPYWVGEGGQYWTVTPYGVNSGAHWILAANAPEQTDDNAYYWPLNYFSFPVRPVCNQKTTCENGFVDLNLPSGTLWGSCNIGSESPEKYGTYFNWTNNPVQEVWESDVFTPTKEDRDELASFCTYSVEYLNDVKGARYTGSNGNSIFLPFAGYCQGSSGPYKVGVGGQYWTVTPYGENSGAHWILAANSPEQADDNAYYWPLSYFGFPVRPVLYVTEVSSSIQSVQNGDAFKIVVFDGKICICNDGSTDTVVIYNTIGKELISETINVGVTTISVPKNHVYIIKTGSKSYKVVL